MELWQAIWSCAKSLRGAFTRQSTFIWFVIVLTAMCVRQDQAGVTSFIRALDLRSCYYGHILHFFHSSAWSVKSLTTEWVRWVLRVFGQYKVNGRHVLIADGIKAAKEGRKMPGVKSLHQESESNSKPSWIMGHSFQAISFLFCIGSCAWSIPLAVRIHEGLKSNNKDRRTLADKLASLLSEISKVMTKPVYLLADSYYACAKLMRKLTNDGHHLITRVRNNAVAYGDISLKKKRRGRPKKYGEKIVLRILFKDPSRFCQGQINGYGQRIQTVAYYCVDLLWRPVKSVVRFVLVDYPGKGRLILMSTDLTLDPLIMIELYARRFRIEIMFKQLVHTIGAFSYHFWLKCMDRIKRKSGNQYLHRKPKEYRQQVFTKQETYERFVIIGIIAQGLMQYLAIYFSKQVWRSFDSWLRTVPANGYPSEKIVFSALTTSLPEFLASSHFCFPFTKILTKYRRRKHKPPTIRAA
jgi:hypothetical protein